MDLEDLEYVQSTLKLLGSKGTTGTQASFLEGKNIQKWKKETMVSTDYFIISSSFLRKGDS